MDARELERRAAAEGTTPLVYVLARVALLPPRERYVLERFYMPQDGGVPDSISVVGGALGVTRERVRRLHGDALGHLQELLNGGEGTAGVVEVPSGGPYTPPDASALLTAVLDRG